MGNVEVTIVCFTYNHEKYIREALDGFVMQKTNFLFEVIVHDDASTDGTTDIIREYEKRYPDIIRPIYQRINTYSESGRFFKYIFPKVSGKYIALCEGDDYWTDTHKLQLQHDYIQDHGDCSLVAHLSKTYYEQENIFRPHTEYDFVNNGVDFGPEVLINNHSIIATASMFFRVDFYRKHEKILKSLSQFDYVTKYLLVTEGYVHVISKIMSVYRKGTIGSWSQRVSMDRNAYVNHLRKSIEFIEKIDQYRDFRYSKFFAEEICSREFNIAMLEKNISALWDRKYMHVSCRRKVILFLENFIPPLFHVLRFIKHQCCTSR